MPPIRLLIVNAEINGQPNSSLLIQDGRIAALGTDIAKPAGAERIDARGGALLPGLKDHHIHLAALAAARDSLPCGPPEVTDAQQLRQALRGRASEQPGQWIRGIGYHESIAGEIDAAWLDAALPDMPDIPIRIQHSGGRLWILNTAALRQLNVGPDGPLERVDGRLSGRLYEGDSWLRERLAAIGQGGFPDLSAISRELASYGITGLTDTSPRNNQQTLDYFIQARQRGALLQDLLLMGDADLDGVTSTEPGIQVGPRKFHLLESALPELDAVIAGIRQAHAAQRNVAFHCVTRVELGFALAALSAAGVVAGDRIEHASVTPPEWLAEMQRIGLTVVTQPALIHERGDQYLADVDADDQPWLYRLRAFMDAGIPLAGSSDAPHTGANPWLAMQAAVSRRTIQGAVIGEQETLSPEQALALYTGPLEQPGAGRCHPGVGDIADLCLLDRPWNAVREDLAGVQVQMTLKAGEAMWALSPSG